MKDVAARAGVSFQTTSKVLRGGGRVAADTRERILAAAHDLGYVPNDVARSLVTRRTQTIGVVVGDLADHVIAQFVVGAEDEARSRDHSIVVVRVAADREAGPSLRSLLERRAAGIVSFAPQLERDPSYGEALRTQLPSVSIHSVEGGGVDLVGSDERSVGRIVADHLVGDHGHEVLGSVTGPASRRVTGIRATGFAQAVRRHGAVLPAAAVEEGAWTPRSGYEATVALLRRRPDVSAVFVHNDHMAVGALHAAAELGRHVPGDLAVVGCDDVEVAAHLRPPLTTVHLPLHEIGAATVRTLLERIEQPDAPLAHEVLPVGLVRRRSCGCTSEPPTAGAAVP